MSTLVVRFPFLDQEVVWYEQSFPFIESLNFPKIKIIKLFNSLLIKKNEDITH